MVEDRWLTVIRRVDRAREGGAPVPRWPLYHRPRVTDEPGRAEPAPPGTSSELRIIGSHGHLLVDENRPQLDIFSTTTERRGRTIGGAAASSSARAEIEAFIRDIQEDRTPLYGLRDGWAAVATIRAAYDSSRSGQPARVASRGRGG